MFAAQRIRDVREQFQSQFPSKSTISKINKYNMKEVVEAEITETATNSLLEHDKKIRGLPRFIADFLDLKPSQHRETLSLKPELIQWTTDNQYLIMPNPEQTNHECLLANVRSIKDCNEGFGLVVWFVHPSLLAQSKYANRDEILKSINQSGESLRYGLFGTKDRLRASLHRVSSFSELKERDKDAATVGELVTQSSIPYLSGPFDYQLEHVPSLKQLREFIQTHLSEVYGVTQEDKVDMYFHTHYSIDTTTLHLHIRVNQLHHGLELDKSILLDDIISCLENGGQIIDIFKQRTVVHKELKSQQFMEKIGYHVKVIPNPYLVDVDEENGEISYELR